MTLETAPQTPTLLESFDLSWENTQSLLKETLANADDGELFLEKRLSESIVFDKGRITRATYDETQGFGIRVVADENVGYAHSTSKGMSALKRAADAAAVATKGYNGSVALSPERHTQPLYAAINPALSPTFEQKTKILAEIDTYLRGKDTRVVQVSASLLGSFQVINILRADGFVATDERPIVRLNIHVVVENNGRRESGSYGMGGRTGYEGYIAPGRWQHAADEALRQALLNLEAVPAPAGEMDVVVGAGWPGVLLHEAIGHGLEGDYHRKKTSTFTGLLGQRIAAKGVTVVDDGTLMARRGSISVDDEGNKSNCTTLIEDGILVGLIQDRQNSRLMGMNATGNGRRESFAHAPMPRMTNTYMLAGAHTKEEVLASVKDGIYAVHFGGGQVDITSGKFVFECTEAYRIRNGIVGEPIKGAMLIGNGADALHRIAMVGNDMALDQGVGTCGKAGQSVPVCVGQPTYRINKITVGGTQI